MPGTLDHLYLIERGAVRLYREETDGTCTLADYRGEGSLFGVTPILSGLKASLNVQSVEDTFCFLLDKGQFLEFVGNNPVFAENYVPGFVRKPCWQDLFPIAIESCQ